MIGVLTCHWAKPGAVERARKLLDGNGEAQSRFAGFVSRTTLVSRDDPTKITTLVLWESDEIYDAWRASPHRALAMDGADALWARPPESERFDAPDGGASSAPNASRTESATLNGLRFSYVEWGERGKPAMLLLHGLTGHAHTWDTFAAALEGEWRIIALDQRGHGDTQATSPPQYDTADFVEDCRALLAHLALPSAVVVGLSMGAHNALALAAEHPELVDALVAVDIGPRVPRLSEPQIAAGLQRLQREFDSVGDAIAAALEDNVRAAPEMIERRVLYNLKPAADGRWAHKHSADVALHWKPDDLAGSLGGIRCPTLIVRGGESDILPAEVAESMTAAIPNATLAVIDGAGHSVPQDAPTEFEEAVRRFLAR